MDIKVPDIGDFKDVPVIEIFVKPGDFVEAETPLVSLESDKATMDVPSSAAGVVTARLATADDLPSPAAGVIKEIKVKLGDRISEGSIVVVLEAAQTAAAPAAKPAAAPAPTAAAAPAATQAVMAPTPTGEVCDIRPTEAEPTSAPAAISMPKAAPRRTLARRYALSPANWASMSPGCRAPDRRAASPRPTCRRSSRAPWPL